MGLRDFFSQWGAKSRQALQNKDVQKTLEDGRRAIELELLHKKQADVDKDQAAAVAGLLAAMGPYEDAAVQVGSLLLLKTTGATGKARLQVRNLTQAELIALEKQPELITQPKKLEKTLKTIVGQASSPEKRIR